MEKIYVLCPGEVVTGGPELLHQFVDALNTRGDVASIIYYPFDKDFNVPGPYKNYNVNAKNFHDINFKNACVVIPEILTGYKRFFPESKIFIWWMSVDNYFNHFPTGLRRLKNILFDYKKSPIKVSKLKDCLHLAQSEYARQFLVSNDLKCYMLSDYLNETHINRTIDLSSKENIICYNPSKGIEITTKLRKCFEGYKFVAIQNMTALQVAELLEKSKVYIDFGNHPGKDRIPREAAMAKCIVITGKKGSANNSIDIPVSEKFKIDESSPDFVEKFGKVLHYSFENFYIAIDEFHNYREKIKLEKQVFLQQVEEFYALINSF